MKPNGSLRLFSLCTFCVCTAIAVFAATGSQQESKMTTIILVRHAEKAAGAGEDPPLSEAGIKRAAALRRVLEKSSATAIFATQYQRTRQTVEPLAQTLKISVTQIDAKNTEKLAAQIREKHRGETVVVAGHSNTVPAIIKALGASEAPVIADGEFDNLFVVTIAEKSPPRLLQLRYGTAD